MRSISQQKESLESMQDICYKKQMEVSVVMCVYNGEAYLADSMESIVNQTFQDWELIVIDDGSTDGTLGILKEYAKRDNRIQVYQNEKNLRLQASLNKALSLAGGRYIVRMDADDICHRERFERQWKFMEDHPEISVSCCRNFTFNETEVRPRGLARRGDSDAVGAMLLFFCPVVHPAVIARGDVLRKWKYKETCTCTEDLDLWLRLTAAGEKIEIQDEYLLMYRQHEKQITAVTTEKQKQEYQEIISRFYETMLFPLTEEERNLLTNEIYFGKKKDSDMKGFCRLCRKILKANREKKRLSGQAVKYAIFEQLLEYYRTGRSFDRLVQGMVLLSPGFVIKELVQRSVRTKRNLRYSKEAADGFWIRR